MKNPPTLSAPAGSWISKLVGLLLKTAAIRRHVRHVMMVMMTMVYANLHLLKP